MQHHVAQAVAAMPKAAASKHGHHLKAKHSATVHKAPVSHSRHIHHSKEQEKHHQQEKEQHFEEREADTDASNQEQGREERQVSGHHRINANEGGRGQRHQTAHNHGDRSEEGHHHHHLHQAH
jgi:hypothetical protein